MNFHALFFLAILLFSQSAVSEELKVDVMGCTLSLQNIMHVTVNGNGSISFSLNPSTSKSRFLTIDRYPGSNDWNAISDKGNRSSVTHGKLMEFDERTITVKGKYAQDKTYYEITDHNQVILFDGPEAVLVKMLECHKRDDG